MVRRLVSSFAFISCAAALAACDASPSSSEPIAGAASAIVRGTLSPSSSTTREVALVWIYWPEEDCVTYEGNGVDDFGGETCSGAWFATRATVSQGATGFEIVQAEPPPAFVHGYDTDLAEAIIAEVDPKDGHVAIDDLVGLSRDHVIVYVPTALPAERIEAQELGGHALGAGFHLVRAAVGEQVEGTTLDGNYAYTSKMGDVVADEPVVIEPITLDADGYRVPNAPALFL